MTIFRDKAKLPVVKVSSHRQRVWIPLATIAIIVAATSTDWPWGVLGTFWVRHSLFASVISGILLLAFAGMGIDVFIRWREDARWKAISRLAYRDLAQVCHNIALLFEWLLGNDDGRASRSVMNDDDRGALDHLAASVKHLPATQRLDAAVQIPDWVSFASVQLQSSKDKGRQVLATWAPSMAYSREIMGVMDDVVELVEDLAQVQLHLHAGMPSFHSLIEEGDWHSNTYTSIDLPQLEAQWMAIIQRAWSQRKTLRDLANA